MEKDCGSCLHNQYLNWQSPNFLNYQMNAPNQMQTNAFSVDRNSLPCIVSANGSLHAAVPQLPHTRTSHAYQQDGWFNSFPCHRQALAPTSNAILTERLSAFACGIGKETTPTAISGPIQKRFIIFDQSGNQTNVIFSSVNGSPTQHLNLENKEPFGSCGSNKKLLTKADPIYNVGTNISDGLDGYLETSDESEMHEDSEELDALLYSDDDSDYNDDEECSTGHSPSKITECKRRESVAGSAEEVASSVGTTKRKRHHSDDDRDDASSVMDTACSLKPKDCPADYASDTESSCCAIPRIQEKETHCSAVNNNKRLKRDRIKETVNILQSIIPDGKGKDDAASVLDEAIRYLKYLKLVAKSLGVVSL